MPNRIIREGILTSHRVNILPPLAELFYRRLMNVVDDYGRYEAHASILRAACYPLKLETITDEDVAKWLRETETAGLVRVYASKGKQYLEINDFNQRVRINKSRHPEPLFDKNQQTTDSCQAITTSSSKRTDAVFLGKLYKEIANPMDDTHFASGRGPRNILGRLNEGYTFEKLEAAIKNYAEAMEITRQECRKKCGNFFGRDSTFEAYLPESYDKQAFVAANKNNSQAATVAKPPKGDYSTGTKVTV